MPMMNFRQETPAERRERLLLETAERHASLALHHPQVTSVEANGAFVRVSYRQEDGQRVEGVFHRVAFIRPPLEFADQIQRAMNQPPRTMIG